MSITFETKIWENDWELVLKTSRLEDLVNRCHYKFDKKVLYINNVNNPLLVEKYAEKLISKGVIDQYIHVNDFADQALSFFDLTKEDLGKGYYYSISELVSIFLAKTTYLLHFSSDAIATKSVNKNWVKQGIDLLENHQNVKVFNLTWDGKYREAKKESINEDSNFYYGYGFSDQMYLVRTQDFRDRIYKETNQASERYPQYGGELFEKRVDAWMRNHSHFRATYKLGSYAHQNFSKNSFIKKLAVALNYPTLLSK